MDNQSTLSQRIKFIYDEVGLPMDKFVKPFGFKGANMYAIMAGKVESIGHHVIETLIKHYNVNLNWLIEGIGEPFKKAGPEPLKSRNELWEPDMDISGKLPDNEVISELKKKVAAMEKDFTIINYLLGKSKDSELPRAQHKKVA